jgi:DNA repair protein RecO (recombination protein O)
VAIVEDEALILRAMRFRETSRIVIALTPRYGKVHLLAKGAREVRSRFGGSLEILTRAQLVFYLKKTRELHLLHRATVETPYLALLARPRDYHLACAAAEFVHCALADEDPQPEVYRELAAFLDARNRAPGSGGADGGLRGLQLRVATLLGYAPQLEVCAHCGRALESPAAFGVAEGGVLCPRCPAGGEALALSPAALLRLRRLMARDPAETAPPDPADATVDRQVGRIVESFLRYHMTGYAGLRSLRCFADWRQIGGE